MTWYYLRKYKTCISRQLWWGHQPHAPDGHIFVAEDSETAHKKAHEHYGKPMTLRRDPDALDMVPHLPMAFFNIVWRTLNEEYYPTDLLIVFDIIFSVYGDDDGRAFCIKTFKDDNHVSDEKGQKCQNLSGNVINPLDLQTAERMLYALH